MSPPPCTRSWTATHPGSVRGHNEDRFVARQDLGLWAVADGAGGHEAGELAASSIAAALEDLPSGLSAPQLLAEVRGRIGRTHETLRAEATSRGPRAMIASTVVILMLRDGHFACLWAGDSRAYRLRAGTLTQVTRDHSLVQEMVEAGSLSQAEADGHPRANVITRAVGADLEGLELEKITGDIRAGDRFLLCSDGLCKTLGEGELAALLAAPDGTPPTELLVAAALARNARDNVTAVAIEVEA